LMLGRGNEALKDLANPAIGQQNDAPLWRALVLAQQGKWAEAREGFKNLDATLPTWPAELQRYAYERAVRAAVEVHDFANAAKLLSEFETLGVPREMQAGIELLKGRAAEGLGRTSEALDLYANAAASWDRPSAAQARLREIQLRATSGEMK